MGPFVRSRIHHIAQILDVLLFPIGTAITVVAGITTHRIASSISATSCAGRSVIIRAVTHIGVSAVGIAAIATATVTVLAAVYGGLCFKAVWGPCFS